MKKKTIIRMIIGTLLFLFIFLFVYSNVSVDFNYYEFKYNLESDFKICHISDYHNKKIDAKMVKKIKEEKPDIIAITGDLIDNGDTTNAYIFLNEIKDIAPIYYVTGNHEADDLNVFNEFKSEILKLGVMILENEVVEITIENEIIKLIGLGDPMFSVSSGFLASFKDDKSFKIVLSHRPERFREYVENNIDLALTGHAHGGLVKIPFVGGLIAPNQGFFPKYYEGVHQENNTKMIVSKGVGNSVVPFRFLNKAELIFITLKKDSFN